MRRVVVTGTGCVSPYGCGTEKIWNAVINGKSCIKPFTFDVPTQIVKFGGEVTELNYEGILTDKEAKRWDDFILYSLVATMEAAKQGNFDMSKENPFKVGVIVGSALGGLYSMQENHKVMLSRGYTKCSPFTIPTIIPNMASGKVAIKLGAKGLCKAVSSACATGAHAIGDAYRSIVWGDADVIFAGGTESKMCDFGIGAFTSARTLSKRNDAPEKASRPFDKDRDGFAVAVGSGMLLLEEYEHAKERGAKILAEIVGYGQSADAYDMVAPDPEGIGAEYAIRTALDNAGITPENIDYINAHGTSTVAGDIAESKTIERIFGDKEKNKNLLVSSTKSMTGHLLGAAGAVEAIFAVKSIQNDLVPPTINLENVDERCGNLDYVPNFVRKHEVNYAMSNSFGFGGCNAVLIFKKYGE